MLMRMRMCVRMRCADEHPATHASVRPAAQLGPTLPATPASSPTRSCGACGNVCRPGESCAGNPKRCKCGPLTASCGPLESCRDDVCVCNPGLTRCDGTCKNLLTDPASCGACGNACTGAGLSGQCVDGVCECAPGFIRCGDQCINVLGDDVNNW